MSISETSINSIPYKIILGSASPRRQELLKSLGFEFLIRPVKVDENMWPKDLEAQEVPLYLAKLKSDAYDEELKENDLLLTSDTIVWCEGKVLNKPINFADGKAMLETLSGRMHEVFTAVCLRSANKQTVFFDATKVYFKELKNAEIEYYLSNFNPYDKAGAYGAQDWIGYVGIEKIEGSFYNVMGLPVKQLYEELLKF